MLLGSQFVLSLYLFSTVSFVFSPEFLKRSYSSILRPSHCGFFLCNPLTPFAETFSNQIEGMVLLRLKMLNKPKLFRGLLDL